MSRRQLGLRQKITLLFATGGLVLAGIMSFGTYLVARTFLVEQRERAVLGQAFADASVVRDGLLTRSRPVSDVLGAVSPPAGSTIFVRRDDEWFSSSLTLSREEVPRSLREQVAQGDPGMVWTSSAGQPALAAGVPVPAVGADFFEVSTAPELQRTLDTLARVLALFAALTAVGGALLGRWSSGRVLAPLDEVAGAAALIAGGELTTRLPATEDPELVTIIGSFNTMVDALAERIERDARFAADVSHELRSPLTTLSTSVQLLQARRDDLPERSREVLDLVVREVARFRSVVEDLLELGRLDAASDTSGRQVVGAHELVRQVLQASGRPVHLLQPVLPGVTSEDLLVRVKVDKQQLNRALVNLLDNADLHGGGVARIEVSRSGPDGETVDIDIDDAGAGVAEADRERIFERFVRGGSRGSLPGTGLGLSLVTETVRAHGGSVHLAQSSHGGARFTLRLPVEAGARGDR